MTDTTTTIPLTSTPVLDPSGRMNQAWWRFFLTILNRTGGSSGADLSQIMLEIAALQAQTSEFDAEIDQLTGLAGTEINYGAVLRCLQISLDEMEGQVAGFNSPIIPPGQPLPTPDAWTAPTLLNSWVNYGSGFNPAGFYKDVFGIVRLRGCVSGGALNTTIFTLPTGYQPTNKVAYPISGSGGSPGSVLIDASGNISQIASPATTLVLESISFRAA